MGKRKSKRKPQSTNKRKQTLDKTFTCPFCSFPKAVECTMQRELGYAVVECRNCRAKYSTKINSLSDPVDVYAAWIDACELLTEQEKAAGGGRGDGQEEEDDEDHEPRRRSAAFDDSD